MNVSQACSAWMSLHSLRDHYALIFVSTESDFATVSDSWTSRLHLGGFCCTWTRLREHYWQNCLHPPRHEHVTQHMPKVQRWDEPKTTMIWKKGHGCDMLNSCRVQKLSGLTRTMASTTLIDQLPSKILDVQFLIEEYSRAQNTFAPRQHY